MCCDLPTVNGNNVYTSLSAMFFNIRPNANEVPGWILDARYATEVHCMEDPFPWADPDPHLIQSSGPLW